MGEPLRRSGDDKELAARRALCDVCTVDLRTQRNDI